MDQPVQHSNQTDYRNEDALMASSSKPKEDPTPEEIMARKRMITGGQYAGNLLDITPGMEIMMNSDGSNGFSMGPDPSDRFMWNEKTGDYRSNAVVSQGLLRCHRQQHPPNQRHLLALQHQNQRIGVMTST